MDGQLFYLRHLDFPFPPRNIQPTSWWDKWDGMLYSTWHPTRCHFGLVSRAILITSWIAVWSTVASSEFPTREFKYPQWNVRRRRNGSWNSEEDQWWCAGQPWRISKQLTGGQMRRRTYACVSPSWSIYWTLWPRNCSPSCTKLEYPIHSFHSLTTTFPDQHCP